MTAMLAFWRATYTTLALLLCFSFTLAQGPKFDLGDIGTDELTMGLKDPNIDWYITESIKNVAKQLAASTMREYHGHEPGGTPGLLMGGTNWWEAGALFEQVKVVQFSAFKADQDFELRWCNTGNFHMSLRTLPFANIVRFLTGDTTYNNITKQALLSQVGPNNAYEPTNQTRVEVCL